MRLHRRSAELDLMDTLNRCYSDAEHSRIELALERLKDLEAEMGPHVHIAYAEGFLRSEFLGQGQRAHQCYFRALELDPHHAFSACNAAMSAPNVSEFRRFSAVAVRLSPGDAAGFREMLRELDGGVPYWQLQGRMAEEHRRRNEPGKCASSLEVALSTATLSTEQEVQLRRMRAQQLRVLDSEAASRRETMVEHFPPQERLALAEAIRELNLAIEIDEYDAELWNLKAAWLIFMRQFEESLQGADRAIELRPEGYARPYQNRATALWRLGKLHEARAAAAAGLRQAESSKSPDQVHALNALLTELETPPEAVTLADIQPAMAQVLRAALVSSGESHEQQGSSPTEGADAFQKRLRRVAPGPNEPMGYVPAMAEALDWLTPEVCFAILVEILNRGATESFENCLHATLYIAAHGEAVMRRDALRLLTLTMFASAAGGESDVRALYRESIQCVSAAATDELRSLDALMRAELSTYWPEWIDLIAPTADVDPACVAKARRNIVEKLRGLPLITKTGESEAGVNVYRGDKRPQEGEAIGCLSLMVALVPMVIGVILKWLGVLPWDWWWVVLVAAGAGVAVQGIVVSMLGARAR